MTAEERSQLLNSKVQETIGNLQVQLISRDIVIKELQMEIDRLKEFETVKEES